MNIIKLFSKHLPNNVKHLVSPFYYRYRSHKANNQYEVPDKNLSRQADAPNHVLIVTIDALRPDHSPNIDIEWSKAITAGTWTFPSVSSIHTGLRPSDHGAVAHTSPGDDTYAMPNQTTKTPVLPQYMDAAGYETYAGCAFLTPFLTLEGWYQTHRCYRDAPAETVVSDYQKWRESRDQTFAYLHLGDLHAEVNPPESYVETHDVDRSLPDLGSISKYKTDFDPEDEGHQYYRKQKLKLYQAALEYVSDTLEPLIAEYGGDTAIYICGDHGECLWEHQELDREITDSRPNYCFGHGGTPFDMVARVPLGTVNAPSPHGGHGSLRDLPQTILRTVTDEVDIPGLDWAKDIPEDRSVVCEATRYGVERKAVYRGEHKLIRSQSDDVTLEATVTDDGESFGELPKDIVSSLLAELPDRWEDNSVSHEVSAITKDQLKALGYK